MACMAMRRSSSGYGAFHGIAHPFRDGFEFAGGVFEQPDDELRHGRGRLEPSVGHHVGHRIVALVADAGEHWDGELGDVGGKVVVVKAHQVGAPAAAANDDHDVEVGNGLVDALEGGDD